METSDGIMDAKAADTWKSSFGSGKGEKWTTIYILVTTQ